MKIAIASGKGGTGKTMVATSMAATLIPHFSINFYDCDVEAPNGHLFLKPVLTSTTPAVVKIPKIDSGLCTACGLCVNVCQYHALAMIAEKVLVFPQLCHGCGSCSQNCPEEAISEITREIGHLHFGMTPTGISHYMGVLTIGEPMPTPVIHQLKRLDVQPAEINIFDSPPGASCAVVATIHDADFVLLVTESTPFGLHDLKQMLGIIEQTQITAGIIINRVGIGDDQIEKVISQTPFPVLMRIPYQKEIATGLGSGQLLTDIFPHYHAKFLRIYEEIASSAIKKSVKHE